VLLEPGATVAIERREIGALDVAWSNDGERLAVLVSRDGLKSVQILRADLVLESEFDIALMEEPFLDTFATSWAPADDRIAVSVDATCFGIHPEGYIIDLGAGTSTFFALYSMYFVSESTIVGSLPPESGSTQPVDTMFRVYLFDLDGDRLGAKRYVSGAVYVAASCPIAGVFAVRSATSVLDRLAGRSPLQLRSASLASVRFPQTVSGCNSVALMPR